MLDTENLWRRFADDLHAYIRRRVPDPADADDLLQDTFVKIHEKLPTLRTDERVAAWVHQIARHVIADFYRRRPPITTVAEEEAHRLAVDVEDETPEHEVAGWLQPMLETLPAGYRQALWLTEYEGLSQVELATRLGLSVSGAKSRVQRGRALLRRQLLACCRFEFDRRGGIVNYHPRRAYDI